MLYSHVHFNISEEVVETVCIAFHIFFLIVESIIKSSEVIGIVLLLTVLE